MKHTLLLVQLLFFSFSSFTQNVGIGTDSFTPQSDALLELRSTTSGFLMPRMSAAQVATISGPTEGLLVYQSTGIKGFRYFDGSNWEPFGGADNLGNHEAQENISLNGYWISNNGENMGGYC